MAGNIPNGIHLSSGPGDLMAERDILKCRIDRLEQHKNTGRRRRQSKGEIKYDFPKCF